MLFLPPDYTCYSDEAVCPGISVAPTVQDIEGSHVEKELREVLHREAASLRTITVGQRREFRLTDQGLFAGSYRFSAWYFRRLCGRLHPKFAHLLGDAGRGITTSRSEIGERQLDPEQLSQLFNTMVELLPDDYFPQEVLVHRPQRIAYGRAKSSYTHQQKLEMVLQALPAKKWRVRSAQLYGSVVLIDIVCQGFPVWKNFVPGFSFTFDQTRDYVNDVGVYCLFRDDGARLQIPDLKANLHYPEEGIGFHYRNLAKHLPSAHLVFQNAVTRLKHAEQTPIRSYATNLKEFEQRVHKVLRGSNVPAALINLMKTQVWERSEYDEEQDLATVFHNASLLDVIHGWLDVARSQPLVPRVLFEDFSGRFLLIRPLWQTKT